MARDSSEHVRKVRRYFDARKAEYDAFYDSPSSFGRWFNRTFRRAVYLRRDRALTLARQYGCKTLLDVGCGSGRNTVFWARGGLECCHGVDISAEMIGQARSLADSATIGDRCTFELADFSETSDDTTFDMVVACGVFDYVVDAESFLRRMSQSATRIIYGSFPGWTLVRSPLRKARYALRGCPTHFYRRAEIERIFRAVGFGEPEIEPVPSGHLAWAVRN
ncbi:MAG: methyltransferase domain-containing protein [Phycisphaerae bacterium]|nr:methyltransferase domain-containing protein [Phycisphaerae bacterium]